MNSLTREFYVILKKIKINHLKIHLISCFEKNNSVVIMLTRIPEDKKVNEITKEERKKLVDTLKDFRMTLTGLRGFNEAIITQGGVNVKEINPSTMESKIVFAGEVLDVFLRMHVDAVEEDLIFGLHGQLGMPREIIDLWRKI